MSDELIARLASDLKPVRPLAMQRLIFGAVLLSGAIAVVAMLVWLGLRADMAAAKTTMMFWTKFGYTMALAALGGAASVVLARPDGRTRWPWIGALALFAVVLAGAFIQLAGAQPNDIPALVWGGTALACPWRIVLLGLPVLLGVLLALRRTAPANPALAGFAAGILSGGTGAWVYSFACAENGMMFLALWYTLGIVIVGGLGAVFGRLLLKW
jgi:hypothetical protein